MVPLKIAIPDGFLEDEVRCDHLVTKQMKEVWAIELDLLAELDRVCKKHNIKYFGYGGTLLGAIRHKGFIPWDDDIDIMIGREDYKKLCEVGPKEFKHPYFFQYITTECGYQYGYAHLRNSETTGMEKSSFKLKYKFNQGIKIDIAPLDSYVEDEIVRIKQKKIAARRLRTTNLLIGCTKDGIYYNSNGFVMFIRKALSSLASPIMAKIAKWEYKRFEIACQKYNNQNTEYVAFLCHSMLNPNSKLKVKRLDIQDECRVPFEFSSIPICNNGEDFLELQYGNWKKLVKGGAAHGETVFDTNKSYKEYINNNSIN